MSSTARAQNTERACGHATGDPRPPPGSPRPAPLRTVAAMTARLPAGRASSAHAGARAGPSSPRGTRRSLHWCDWSLRSCFCAKHALYVARSS
eukprot:6186900-Prymnesium_polylepis.2